jgi:hypothetical protein
VLVGADPGRGQVEQVAVRLAAGGYQQLRRGHRLRAVRGQQVEPDAVAGRRDPLDGGVQPQADLLAEGRGKRRGDVLVVPAQHHRATLDHGDLGAQRAEHVAHLGRDEAAAEDRQ